MDSISKDSANDKQKCLVIGSANLDFFFYVKELPEMGQTILSKESKTLTGGKGFNQAFYINRLSPNSTRFLACVADDFQGLALRNAYLKCRFLNDSDLNVFKGKESGSAFICIDRHGENTIVVNSGANLLFTEQIILSHKEAFVKSDYFVCQCEINLDVLAIALQYSKKVNPQIQTVLNLSPMPSVELGPLLNDLDYLIVNQTETEALFQKSKLNSIPELANHYRIRHIIATNGPNPVSIFFKETQKIEVVAVESVGKVVDTCGAGDCFLGGMVAGLMRGFPLKQAVQIGSLAAANKIGKFGAQADISKFESFVMNLQL